VSEITGSCHSGGVLLLLTAGLEVRVADLLPVGPGVLRVGGLELVVLFGLARWPTWAGSASGCP
jgi:hypothetical protein